MNNKLIPLSVPNISGNEWEYVKDCLDTGWISSAGGFVGKFEEMVADYVGAKFGVATVNGTCALHISLQLSGVKRNDYVIIPNITFVATANSVKYTGADPILIDVDLNNWQMNLDLLEEFLTKETYGNLKGDCILKDDGRCIRVIMPVHVQGNMTDMDRLIRIADQHNLLIIEDAAEALGTTYKSKHSGTFGLMGCFSFNGNKIISTGGGGVIVSDDELLAKKAKHITTTAKVDPMSYYHDEIGYNYRMVNVLAAIGVAQMEVLDSFVRRKKEIGAFYKEHLSGVGDIGFQTVLDDVDHNNWLFTIKTSHQTELLKHLNDNKIISRPFWMPMNKLPMYKDCLYVVTGSDACEELLKTCLAIPCSTSITDDELERVVVEIKNALY
ncbi:MAG: LegC family aminotransferase [Candidatus Scalindua sp.]|nr:LegC family aminotransferase [Candidatus Scalindua sp.]